MKQQRNRESKLPSLKRNTMSTHLNNTTTTPGEVSAQTATVQHNIAQNQEPLTYVVEDDKANNFYAK